MSDDPDRIDLPAPPGFCPACWAKAPLIHRPTDTVMMWCSHSGTLAAYSPARKLWSAWAPLTQEQYEAATLGAIEDFRELVGRLAD